MDRKGIGRRGFVRGVAGVAGAVAGRRLWGSTAERVTVRVRADEVLSEIAPEFMGLGYEISSVARAGLLSAANKVYAQLVRTLGVRGVVRVGGNTSDYSSYAAGGGAVSLTKGTVVNDAVLKDLGGFLEATGWRLMWGLNLGEGTVEVAVAEAKAVRAAVGERLLAVEIGNEPDLFRKEGHRKEPYGYEAFLAEWRRYREALRREMPGLPLAGPDVAGKTDWVTRFAADEGKDLKVLTHHYYREGQNAGSTLDKLLRPDPKLRPELETLRAAAKASGVPYRICEVNSFSGGGRPGVSDTFGAALWVLEYMFELALAGCSGVNLETGVNQRGFVSSYSPIGDDEKGQYRATPEYYGMLAFAQAGKGNVVRCEVDAKGRNVSAYATRQVAGDLVLTVINKESAVDVWVVEGMTGGSVMRLTGPSLEAKKGVLLGGAEVSGGGGWEAAKVETVRYGGVLVAPGSAAIVRMVG